VHPPAALSPLGSRPFARLWAGQFSALMFDGAFSTMLIWLALDRAGALALSVVATARLVPRMVLVLVGGALADRLPRAPVLRATLLAQAGCAAALATLAAANHAGVAQLAALGAVSGAAGAPFFPALNATVPDLVAPRELPAANSLIATGRLLGQQFLGPGLGGLMLGAIGTTSAFAAIAIGYAIGGLAIPRLRSRQSEPSRVDRGEGFGASLVAGARYVVRTRWLLLVLLSFAVSNLLTAGPAVTLVPDLVHTRFHGSPSALGALLASYGIGGTLAVLTVVHLVPMRDRPALRLLYSAVIASSLCLGLLGLAGNMLCAMALYALAGASAEAGNVLWTTVLQRQAPRNMIARLSSIDWFLSLSLVPASTTLAALAATRISPGNVLLTTGTTCALAMAIGAGLVSRSTVADPLSDEPAFSCAQSQPSAGS
jgi:predicted MFS family arabinose efflux permease